ncbi:LRR receptor-like kinase family protein, putative [Medicago truncatula]|uniref:LRR receptor-like kinase family protein, putative n=1 Tax=Medicago truncatula TaxID=3880 RepID=G7J894_MEDTR|nr:LRR receptor-like kinase family protein, putative [Medicago truncatula]
MCESVTDCYNNLKNLTHLTLGYNYLTSTTSLNFQFFDSLKNSTQLQVLMVNYNNLTGELPNSLSGSIPQGMQKFQNLTSTSLGQNYFTGVLPLELGTLKKLERLLMYQNRLSGEISDIFDNFTNLYILAIGNNQFSGRIPASIGQCTRLSIVDMEMNNLVGAIPMEIFQFNDLTTLNLQGNSLKGSIPPELKMEHLETMVISNNWLSGNIPKLEVINLEKLEYMVRLNLSFNDLEGDIPMKGVFMNLIMHKLGVTLYVAGKKHKRNILLPIILPITGSTVLFTSILYLLWLLSSTPLNWLPQNVSYSDIRLATNNFSDANLVGKGGFGSVYKGVLNISTYESQTTTLAVKVFDLQQSKASQSFCAECEALKNVRHRNLVKVITVRIFYYLIIFQYHYVGKYRNNNYISYLSIVSLN